MATIAAAPGTIARPAPSAEQLPLVAVVRADWCPACRRLEPVVKQLEAELKGRARFVYLDLTSDDTSAHAARLAAELGIDGFYEANGGSTGVVAVFGRDHASPVRVRGLEPEAYRQAIAAAAGSFSADRAARPE
jgi:thiol-disulfide isomerase/thioredoxin